MGTFVSKAGRVISSDVLPPSDANAGDILVNAANGAALVIAQNPTTGAPVPVSIGATPSLVYEGLAPSAIVQPGRFIECSGPLQGKHVGVAGGAAVGVSIAAATPGPGVRIRSVAFGVAVVETGGAINPNDPLASDAQGRAVVATATAVNGAGPALVGSQVLGRALQGAPGPGAFIQVMFQPGGLFPASVV